MTAKPILLDTSALLTLIEDEAGAARVEQVLRGGAAIIVWTSLLEVVYVTQQERGVPEAERRYALLKVLPVTLLWSMDEPILLIAARFKAGYRVSFADAIIAAYAAYYHALLLHKDPQFEALASEVDVEALPYKAARP
jgi:predicted nucleic acid-binding protein